MSPRPRAAVPSSETLRLAVALAHCVPPLAVELGFRSGRRLLAGHRPAEQGTRPLCHLRQVLIGDMATGLVSWMDDLQTVEITGAGVHDHGGGLYGAITEAGEHRCFAGLLPVHQVIEVMTHCPPSLDSDSITSSIKCDEELGVTSVVLGVGHPSLTALLEDAASWALSACMVEELIMHSGSDH